MVQLPNFQQHIYCSTCTLRCCLRCWIGSFCSHLGVLRQPHIRTHCDGFNWTHNTRFILAQRLVIKSTQVSHIWRWYVYVSVCLFGSVYFLSLYGAPYKMNKSELLMLLLTVSCTSFSTRHLYLETHINTIMSFTFLHLFYVTFASTWRCLSASLRVCEHFFSSYLKFCMWMQWNRVTSFQEPKRKMILPFELPELRWRFFQYTQVLFFC